MFGPQLILVKTANVHNSLKLANDLKCKQIILLKDHKRPKPSLSIPQVLPMKPNLIYAFITSNKHCGLFILVNILIVPHTHSLLIQYVFLIENI